MFSVFPDDNLFSSWYYDLNPDSDKDYFLPFTFHELLSLMPEMVNNLILNLKVSHAEALRLQCVYVVGNGPVSDPGSTVKGNFLTMTANEPAGYCMAMCVLTCVMIRIAEKTMQAYSVPTGPTRRTSLISKLKSWTGIIHLRHHRIFILSTYLSALNKFKRHH